MSVIIWDAHDAGYTFFGYVLVVNHHIGENHFSSVDLWFARLPTDELNPGTRLENTLEIVSGQVTHQFGPMSRIHQKILGCNAVGIDQFYTDLTGSQEGSFRAATDPLAAYRYNWRSIVNISQYMELMGLGPEGMALNCYAWGLFL